MAQSHQRIHPRGPSRRQITRKESDGGHHHRGCRDRRRVAWRQSIHLTGDHAPGRQGGRNPKGGTDEHEHKRVPQQKPEHAATTGAERHSDADLAGPSRYRIRHDAIEADRGKQQSQKTEGT